DWSVTGVQTCALPISVLGEPVMVQVSTRKGAIHAKVWRINVGRCDLLLLDSNVAGNAPEDRGLSSRLYGGNDRMRIRQELLLGEIGRASCRGSASMRE